MVDIEPSDAGVEGGVGVTALMVAAARAIETHRDDSLAQDVYAEHFVRAAQVSADWPVRLEDVPDGDANPLWGRLGRYFGLRTRVFDDFLVKSAHEGARQVVLLGAGLDSRSLRLDWPAGTVVFEIDQEEVLLFKSRVLDSVGATPVAARRSVAADLREDWVEVLTGAGFDPARPTVWLAEGLLLYLPNAVEQALFESVDRLSAPGSALAFEVKLHWDEVGPLADPLYPSTQSQTGVDTTMLFDRGSPPDSVGYLAAKGWSTLVRSPFAFTEDFGRGPRPQEHDSLAGNQWVFANKP